MIERILRSLMGIVAGSVVAAAAYLVLFMLWSSDARVYSQFSFVAAGFGTLAILMFAIPCGLLSHAILYALKWRGLLVYNVVAAAEACLYVIVGSRHIWAPNLGIMFSTVPSAIVCATIAWLIRRPDKDVKQDTPPPTR